MAVTDDILLNVENRVATILLNRPEKRNAFTDEMLNRWIGMLDECQARKDVNIIVISGAGTAFCSGGDIGRMEEKAARGPLGAKNDLWEITQALPRKMHEVDKPLIAAVNGPAAGGGLDVALMCDIRLASSTATFAQTYARLGLFPGAGGAYYLPRLIGASKALELFWTSRFVNAAEALDMGLVNHVYPQETFRDQVRNYVESIARAAPLSVRYIKRALYQGLETSLVTHLDQASSHMAMIRTSKDHMEAVAAFREKRLPKFNSE
jgi:enoyl-CoA hydratase/carnithine racemase